MSTPPLSNSFEGGTDGVQISPANSGGASGNAFDNVTVGAGSVINYSNEQAAHGGLSCKIVTPATGQARTTPDWTGLGGGSSDIWFREYIYRAANPSATHYILGVRDTGGLACMQAGIRATGLLRWDNAAGAAILALDSTVAIALGSWNRFEWRVKASTTLGEIEWWLYTTMDAPIGSHADHGGPATGLALAATADQLRFGMVTNAIASDTSYFDDPGVSLTGPVGPAVLVPTVQDTLRKPMARYRSYR